MTYSGDCAASIGPPAGIEDCDATACPAGTATHPEGMGICPNDGVTIDPADTATDPAGVTNRIYILNGELF